MASPSLTGFTNSMALARCIFLLSMSCHCSLEECIAPVDVKGSWALVLFKARVTSTCSCSLQQTRSNQLMNWISFCGVLCFMKLLINFVVFANCRNSNVRYVEIIVTGAGGLLSDISRSGDISMECDV